VTGGEVDLRSVDAVRDAAAWDRLALSAANLFATPEWVTAWWRHWGDGGRLPAVGCGLADGRLGVVLPIYASRRRPVRVLRWIGHGPGDQLGPVCAPEDRPLAARALRAVVEREQGLLLADRLPGDEGWEARLGGVALRREPSPVLRLDTRDWDVFLGARSANFRQQLRRRERRLAREHRLRYRLTDSPDRLDADLDVLFALHGARWGERSSVLGARGAAFHREFARLALERGWLRLWIMELDGRPVAAWHGFRYAGCEWYYQAGRDPAYDHASVGLVLLAHTVRGALEDGVCEYRLLRGAEAYKQRFQSHDAGLVTLAVAPGRLRRAALTGVRRALARPASRRLARRLVGGVV
jgi:CelD/BcsL family acetyltransferase involved in cellulose biosynthesis